MGALAEVASRIHADHLDEVGVWLLDLADVGSGLPDLASLDQEERERLGSLQRDQDRVRFAAAHVLLRELLAERLALAPSEVEFVREPCPRCGGPHGRPAVGAPSSPTQFSLSYGGSLVLVGIAAIAVGVDVEPVPAGDSWSGVAARLHPAERDELAALAPTDRSEAFARLWARKEAYLKGVGTGIAVGLETEYVGEGGAAIQPPPAWTIVDVSVPVGYAGAVAARLDATSRQRPGPG